MSTKAVHTSLLILFTYVKPAHVRPYAGTIYMTVNFHLKRGSLFGTFRQKYVVSVPSTMSNPCLRFRSFDRTSVRREESEISKVVP